jgi:uncharacterized protein (TIGR00255 family)
MTGYATATASAEGATVTVTLKSVNHRFLDLHMRLPQEADPFEAKLRQALRARLARGHVDVTVSIERTGATIQVSFDLPLVRAYVEAFSKLQNELHLSAEPNINELLKLPGAVSMTKSAAGEAGVELLDKLLFQALDNAIDAMDEMRGREGAALCEELLGRAKALEMLATRIADLREGADRRIFERLMKRITELTGQSATAERIAQEAALLCERGDVSEEIARLKAHVGQFRETLVSPPWGGETGKRFDFLLQEMNREANTILSKTSGDGSGLEITDLAIQAKAEIEKLREQVQNLQ